MKEFFQSIIIAVVVAWGTVSFADHPSVVKLVSRFQVCTTDPWTGQKSCHIAESMGSAVCVGEKSGYKVFATCHHVLREFEDNPKVNKAWIEAGGKIYPVQMVGSNAPDDLALVAVVSPFSPVEIEDDVSIGSRVDAIGYPLGRFQSVRQRIASRDGGNVWGDQSVTEGHSGGGLFSGARLTGIVRARSADRWPGSLSVSTSKVRRLLDHWKIRHRVRERGTTRVANPEVVTVPPPPEVPIDSPVPVPAESAGMGLIGPMGPMGVAGPAGSVGPKGETGAAGAVGAAGQAGPAGTVTVILIGADGKEVTRATNVEAGSVVRLNITQVEKKE